MRILFYSADRVWSARARIFAVAARHLRERGHQVTYVCGADTPVETHLDVTAFEVVPIDAGGTWQVAALRLRSVLADRLAEVIFVHTEREQLAAASAGKLTEGASIVRRIGHGDAATLERPGPMTKRLAANSLIFVSDDEMRQAPAALVDSIPSAVVPLGIHVSAVEATRPVARAAIGAASTAQLIACLGEPENRLRAATALRVVALLAPRHPELRLLMIGAGAADEDLRMHAAALRLNKVASFSGARDDDLAVIRAADLGWVAADGDAAALALLDLMAARVPLLMERDAVAEQYVTDRISGVLLPSGDPPAAAAAVARLLAHDEHRLAMADAAHARVTRDFPLDAMITGFEQVALAFGERSRR